MPRLLQTLRDFARDERATSTLEFVIMFPVVITLFIAVFETGIILSRQVLMERSLDEAVRLLRLVRTIVDPVTGQPRPLTADDIAQAICDNTRAIPNCDQVLVVQLTRIDQTNYDVPTPDIACVNRGDLSIQPSNQFQQGTDNELILIRTCAIIDPLLPFSGFGLNLARDDTGGLHMTAASVLVNEPQ
ncbi:TadE/TadG family type IV pilus assembly protein [Roseicyclus persicicus]|uniref:Pilus assembly protein n=1 Tax=Roseicyclus persicicus TaxID=2650661 RepID=A0A7X6GVY2_9RHOB|nr:TadE/TadG family type IV pilus assembly protein [Roseibacterium persicicum]NKX43397.1 pilus assembly protein [Roseibacterium persicicum]